MRSALTVAGSDSGGGAGIQADLKSFAAVGVHGCSVLTCITAQNTRAVESIYPLPVVEIARQLDAVLSDFNVRTAKTGMLYSADIVKVVAKQLKGRDFPIVVDPVMVATVGDTLQGKDFRTALVRNLVPIADLVTPNLFEAGELAGLEVKTVDDMRVAAKAISKLGAEAVLVKGGHLRGRLVDLLYHSGRYHELTGYRYPKELHGSGCTLAASIAAYLAKGLGVKSAVEAGRRRVAAGFQTSYRPGKGVEVINSQYRPEKFEIWREVATAAHELSRTLALDFIPEVGINIGFAVEGAKDFDDICALSGRMHRVGKRLVAGDSPDFGASKHIARIILAAMSFHPAYRSAANLKYSEKNLRAAERAGLRMGTFSRAEQPKGTSTMEWGTRRAVEELGRMPDLIYDLGDIGKEPMIRVLGKNPKDVVNKIRLIVRGRK